MFLFMMEKGSKGEVSKHVKYGTRKSKKLSSYSGDTPLKVRAPYPGGGPPIRGKTEERRAERCSESLL